MEYYCSICEKKYKSYKSLWKHNYIYHKKDNNYNTINVEKPKKKKFICDKCNLSFINLEKITEHTKNECRPSVKSNNIYTFKTDTFGKNKYNHWKGGDIYIIQTEFNLKEFYKIGVTTNLYKRLGQYRCGAVLEPKLHYYYPCKNIKETDKILKARLQKYNVKREIYRAENINDLRNLIKEIQKESNSSEMEIIPENKQCDIQGCEHCDLYFTNQQDLDIHIKNIHKPDDKQLISNKIELDKKYSCRKCNKSFDFYQSRWRHEKNCKENIPIRKNEIDEMKKEMENLKTMLEKVLKIHSKTIQKEIDL